MERPGRPLGVSLAIFASVMLYTVFPLMIVAMVLLVARHFQNIDFGELQPLAVGGDFLGLSPATLVIQAIVALVFLVIAIFAWRGRPAYIRYVMLAAVILLTLYSLAMTIMPTLTNQNLPQGISSLDSLMSSVSCGQFAMSALVSLYVVWYLNRGPARAFYRGYYLPDPANNPVEPAAET
jgi:hypothetical protein